MSQDSEQTIGKPHSALVGGTKLAEILGTTPQVIANSVASGRLSVAGQGPKGALFDVGTAKGEWECSSDMAAAKSHNKKGSADQLNDAFRKARARKMAADAKMAELSVKVREGELIEKKQAFQDGADLGAVLLGALQAWPSRLAPEFAGMRDATEHDFYMRLTKECNDLIVSIRKRLNLE